MIIREVLSFREIIPTSGSRNVTLISVTVKKLQQCKHAGVGRVIYPSSPLLVHVVYIRFTRLSHIGNTVHKDVWECKCKVHVGFGPFNNSLCKERPSEHFQLLIIAAIMLLLTLQF